MSDSFWLSKDSSKARIREAENARKNRAEILKAYSQGKVTRRDLMKWGLITAGGALAPIHGLRPFATSAYASGGAGSGMFRLTILSRCKVKPLDLEKYKNKIKNSNLADMPGMVWPDGYN